MLAGCGQARFEDPELGTTLADDGSDGSDA
jgi:hypothetical protein